MNFSDFMEAVRIVACIAYVACFAILLGYGFVRLVCHLAEVPWRDEERRR